MDEELARIIRDLEEIACLQELRLVLGGTWGEIHGSLQVEDGPEFRVVGEDVTSALVRLLQHYRAWEQEQEEIRI